MKQFITKAKMVPLPNTNAAPNVIVCLKNRLPFLRKIAAHETAYTANAKYIWLSIHVENNAQISSGCTVIQSDHNTSESKRTMLSLAREAAVNAIENDLSNFVQNLSSDNISDICIYIVGSKFILENRKTDSAICSNAGKMNAQVEVVVALQFSSTAITQHCFAYFMNRQKRKLSCTADQFLCALLEAELRTTDCRYHAGNEPVCDNEHLPSGLQIIILPENVRLLVRQLEQRERRLKSKELHFGAALNYEDGLYGMPAPAPFHPELTEFIRAVRNQTIDTNFDASNQIMRINRASCRCMTASTGTCPVKENAAFEGPLLIVTVGSMIPLKVKSNLLGNHTIVLRENCALYVANPVDFEWSVQAKTRFKVNKETIKRTDSWLLVFRYALPIDLQPELNSEQIAGLETSKLPTIPVNVSDASAEALEHDYVHSVYNSIAAHFSSTRHSPWPKIEDFVRNIQAGLKVADIGCGNGKYMGLNTSIDMVGCDISPPLVAICRQRGYNVIEGNALDIPFASNAFDVALSVAVLHHVSTNSRRLCAINELLRIVKPCGKILISAWALEQDLTSRRDFASQDVMVPWTLTHRFIASDSVKIPQEPKSVLKNEAIDASSGRDSNKTVTVQRYCHVYREGELQLLLSQASPNRIIETWFDRGNWVVIAEKLAL